jgi:hypothetical protein
VGQHSLLLKLLLALLRYRTDKMLPIITIKIIIIIVYIYLNNNTNPRSLMK